MTTRDRDPLQGIKARIADLDPRAIDELYGLEPVFEPGESCAALGDFVELQCPACGEVYGTHVDLTDGSRVYIEDCQVCCQPMQISLEVNDAGELIGLATATLDE